MYTYDWIMLVYGRNQENMVEQLSFNINKPLKNDEFQNRARF